MTARPLRTILLLAGAVLFVACGGGEATAELPVASSIRPAAPVTGAVQTAATGTVIAGVPAYDFATGPAVLVSAGFVPSTERIESTGAYLPVNGKPTLVFVDVIW